MLSDLKFENSAGSITLARVMFGISHAFSWAGSGVAKVVTSINATGNIKHSEVDIINLQSKSAGRGVLTLPNGTYSNMMITSASAENGIWASWGVVTLSFSDETENGTSLSATRLKDGENYFTLYSPRFIIKPASMRLSDKAIHMADGYMRQKLGLEMFSMEFSGVLNISGTSLPNGLLDALERMNELRIPESMALSDVLPDIAGNFNPKGVIITDSRISWKMDKKCAEVSFNMLAPPQRV